MKNYWFVLFTLFYLLVWAPFQAYILEVDGRGLSVDIVVYSTIIALFFKFNRSIKKSISNKSIVIWILWFIYAFSITCLSGYDNTSKYQLFRELFIPLFAMFLLTLRSVSYDRILKCSVYSLLINLIITALNIGIISHVELVATKINSNVYGLVAVVLFILVFLLYKRHKFNLTSYIVFILISLYCIFRSDSRNALLGVSIFVILYLLLSSTKNNLFKRILTILIILLAFSAILKFTDIGNRIQQTKETTQENERIYTGTVFDYLGDRGIFYVQGYAFFQKNPVFGNGLYSYQKFSGEYIQHSEYMVQLSELGLVGSVLFLAFYISLFRRLLKIRKSQKDLYNENSIFLSALITILFLGIGTRLFSSLYVYILLGFIIRYTMDNKITSKICK